MNTNYKSLHEVAFDNLIAQGLKVGSTVKVIGKAESFSGGWNNTWDMDECVGIEMTVKSVNLSKEIFLNDDCSYPAFVLELVPPKKATASPVEYLIKAVEASGCFINMDYMTRYRLAQAMVEAKQMEIDQLKK